MIELKKTIFILVFIKIVINGGCERTKDKMYEKIDGSNACFRRLNATNQIGCSSNRGGSIGIIHFCHDQTNLNFILENGTGDNYIPIIPAKLFTIKNVKSCKESGKISGLVLYDSKKKPDYFTHDNQCPNLKSSLKGTCSDDSIIWNPHGTGMLFQNIPFPIFYVQNETKIDLMNECFKKFNNFSYETHKDRSLCSIELASFMYATSNTPTCIRRSNSVTNLNPVKFCDPLGDQNVWSSLFPLSNNSKYIIIAAKMDSTTMFDKTTGAISSITGFVTLLSTANLLKTMLPKNNNKYDKNVIFVLFNGETYDYIGSQRFLYEMSMGNFPFKGNKNLPIIKLADIDLYVELSQLSQGKSVVGHFFREKTEITNFLLKLNSNKNDITLDESLGTLPPASLHTFVKNRTDFPGIVLTNHKSAYTNDYYNSIYDDVSNLNFVYYNESELSIPNESIQKFIANVSGMIAKSVYQEVTNETYFGEDQVNIELINELLYCYLENPNCKVHKAIQKLKFPDQPISLYVGVEIISNLFTSLVGLTLAWFTGDALGPNCTNTNTPDNYPYKFYNFSKSIQDLNTTICYRVSMNFTEAISPAFIIKDYDWNSGQYSTWTESTWNDIGMRMFLKPSSAHEKMTISIGSIVLIFSFVFVYFIKSRSDVLFAPVLPTLAPTNC